MNFIKTLLLERHLTHVQAALYTVFAYFMFSLSDTMGKWLMSEGYARTQILVANSLPSLIILVAFMIHRHGWRRSLYTPYKKLHIARCLTLISVTFFSFKAIAILPLADFYGIAFTAPCVVTIGAFLIFREKTDIREWLVIIAKPEYGSFNIGYLFAIGSVLSISAATLIVRRIGRDEDPYLFVIFCNIGLIAANILPALANPLPQITLMHVGVMAIYGFTIPTAVLVLSAVYARAPSVMAVAPFQYLQIIWGVLFGFVIFGDIPQLNTIIGSVIVIGSGLYILFHHAQRRRREARLT